MIMSKAFINNIYVIQKIPGKGGWSYVVLKGMKDKYLSLKKKEKKPANRTGKETKGFSWVRVSGKVDSYELIKYNLFPMKTGDLFLPIKADMRKAIKKKEGDTVRVVLYLDETPLVIPQEFLDCLKEEPKALKTFKSLSESEQKHYLDWIYSAKKEETKIERMANAINKLVNGEKFYLMK